AVLVNKTQLNISWIASFDNVGVDYYIIYREGKEIVRTQILSYVDEEVMECTEYTYTVSAVDGSGLMSGLSDPYPVSVPDQTSPTVPTGLIALVKSHNQVDLSWNMSEDSCGEVQYKVYRNKVHINTLSDNNYVDSELAANTLYYYKVSAIDNSDNESIPSITVSARTDKVPTNIILNEISRDLNIYPNPSYDEVNIVYLSTEPSQIKVEVRDIIGKLIKVVYNGHSDIGDNKFVWDGTNEENNNVFPGMYICNVFINNKLYKAKLFIIQ
ncbi:MAG: T9SS type A sorting domain-containing protein, partial [Bacteroidales bacterium]|nr:T9SS type A sorting domain-containing protein [Bacteroidales bacterium]